MKYWCGGSGWINGLLVKVCSSVEVFLDDEYLSSSYLGTSGIVRSCAFLFVGRITGLYS